MERFFIMTLTKADIAEILFTQNDMNKQDAKQLSEAFFEEIRVALESGTPVKILGFGNFTLRDKPSRPGRNPKTGDPVEIEKRRVTTFIASQKFKEMLKESPNKAMN